MLYKEVFKIVPTVFFVWGLLSFGLSTAIILYIQGIVFTGLVILYAKTMAIVTDKIYKDSRGLHIDDKVYIKKLKILKNDNIMLIRNSQHSIKQKQKLIKETLKYIDLLDKLESKNKSKWEFLSNFGFLKKSQNSPKEDQNILNDLINNELILINHLKN